jgi:GDPmannose 4,6-dehydratase
MRQFVERAFCQSGRGIAWQGEGDTERGIDANTGEILVEVEPKLRRPAEVQFLWAMPARQSGSCGGCLRRCSALWWRRW